LGDAIEARLTQVLDSGAVVSDDDFTAPSPLTGELCHYESKWYPARAGDGQIIGVAVLISDVTERHRSEEALLRSNDRTVRLQQATAALAGALTVDDIRRVLHNLGRSAGFATHIEIELREGEPVPVELLSPLVADPGPPDGIVALPLVVSGGRIGTLRLTRGEAEVAGEDRAFLGALAGQCAIALERARLYERERSTAMALQRSLLG
jgi:hypothetical protein